MAASLPNCVNFQNTAKKYVTSTGKCHRFIPKVPQEFDCRVKANTKPESVYKDLTIRDEEFKTCYVEGYPRKIVLPEQWYRSPPNNCLQYVRNVEEQLLIDPPSPIIFRLSEMKDSFRMNYHRSQGCEDAIPPSKLSRCYISKLGSEQQPAIPASRKGFWKWNDPYLTMYKSQYLPYTEVDEKIKRKILTYYNQGEFDLPPVSGNKTMFDRCTFKNVLPVRLQSRLQERIPNFGMQSEYGDHYVKQTCSYLYPHLQDRCTVFDDPLSPASRFQNLAPPGMYCSDYCTYGGHSVRRTLDQTKKTKDILRTKNCCKLKT